MQNSDTVIKLVKGEKMTFDLLRHKLQKQNFNLLMALENN